MRQRPLTLLWARHAITAWNLDGRLQGQTDIDVEDAAVRDAMDPLVGRMDGADVVVSSTLARAAHSAAYLAGRLGLEHRRDPRLCEMSFGPFEGRRMAGISAADSDRLLAWMREPFARPLFSGDEAEHREIGPQIESFLDGLEAFERVAIIGHTVQSRWLEHLCGQRGICFVRLGAASSTHSATHDVAGKL